MSKVSGRAPSGQALAVPVEPVSRLDPTGFDPSRVVSAFNKRLMIYRTKRDSASPFGEDCYNRQDATRYVVEAIELLAREAGLSDVVYIEPTDD
jgi:hypothetical protein